MPDRASFLGIRLQYGPKPHDSASPRSNITQRPGLRMLHSRNAEKCLVQLQKLLLSLDHENNPPDGFLEYRKCLHPPPGGAFIFRRRHLSSLDVVALFFAGQIEAKSQRRDLSVIINSI
jgi:hypothetical protein